MTASKQKKRLIFLADGETTNREMTADSGVPLMVLPKQQKPSNMVSAKIISSGDRRSSFCYRPPCFSEIRAQLGEQLKVIADRTETQVAVLSELEDYFRKR